MLLLRGKSTYPRCSNLRSHLSAGRAEHIPKHGGDGTRIRAAVDFAVSGGHAPLSFRLRGVAMC
jgi:hypothetical protein